MSRRPIIATLASHDASLKRADSTDAAARTNIAPVIHLATKMNQQGAYEQILQLAACRHEGKSSLFRSRRVSGHQS